jgi:hypothetical protein
MATWRLLSTTTVMPPRSSWPALLRRLRAMTAFPRPSGATSAEARPQPSVPVAHPGPPPGNHPEAHLGAGPVPGHEQHAPPAPRRRLQAPPYRGRGFLGRAQQDHLAPVEQRCHHLRPGGAGIGDQQGSFGVQAEAGDGQTPSLGQPGDPAGGSVTSAPFPIGPRPCPRPCLQHRFPSDRWHSEPLRAGTEDSTCAGQSRSRWCVHLYIQPARLPVPRQALCRTRGLNCTLIRYKKRAAETPCMPNREHCPFA